MPINKDALLRFLSIDLRLRKFPPPSLDELKSSVEKEMTNFNLQTTFISKETIKKDLQTLRLDFGSPIDYNRGENFYYYTIENYSFLNIGDDLIRRLISKIKLERITSNDVKFTEIIQFEEETSNKGWEFIADIANAIILKKKIQVNYKSSYSVDSKIYILNPLLLKENRNYWYVLATVNEFNEIRTFNLSRFIEGIIILNENANIPVNFKAVEFFNHSIGISSQVSKPVDVVLVFSPKQANYLLEKPLHKSQKVIINSKDYFKISIYVEPTYELIANILSYGENVKVESPVSLVELIMEKIKLMNENYLTQ